MGLIILTTSSAMALASVDYLFILRGINRNKMTEKGNKTGGIAKRVSKEEGIIHQDKLTVRSYVLAEVSGSG